MSEPLLVALIGFAAAIIAALIGCAGTIINALILANASKSAVPSSFSTQISNILRNLRSKRTVIMISVFSVIGFFLGIAIAPRPAPPLVPQTPSALALSSPQLATATQSSIVTSLATLTPRLSPTPAINVIPSLPTLSTTPAPFSTPIPSAVPVMEDFIQLAPQARRCIGNQCVAFSAQNDVTISGHDLNVSLKPGNTLSISVEYPQTSHIFQADSNEFFTAIVVPPQAQGNSMVSVQLVPDGNAVPVDYPPLYNEPIPNNGHPVPIEIPIVTSRGRYQDKNFLSGKNLQFKLVVQADSPSATGTFIWTNPQIRKP